MVLRVDAYGDKVWLNAGDGFERPAQLHGQLSVANQDKANHPCWPEVPWQPELRSVSDRRGGGLGGALGWSPGNRIAPRELTGFTGLSSGWVGAGSSDEVVDEASSMAVHSCGRLAVPDTKPGTQSRSRSARVLYSFRGWRDSELGKSSEILSSPSCLETTVTIGPTLSIFQQFIDQSLVFLLNYNERRFIVSVKAVFPSVLTWDGADKARQR